MVIYGRDRTLEEIRDSNTALLIVTGDSGVGKSAVLGAAAATTPNATGLAPLPSSTGSLRSSLLFGLADIAADRLSSQSDVHRFGEAMLSSVKTMAATHAVGLGKAFGAELLGVIKHRINPDLGDAVGEYIGQVRAELDDTVVKQIEAAVPQAVSDSICALVEAALALFGPDEGIVIYLDRGERLSSEDRRLLVDVVEKLPTRCRIRLGFSTATQPQRSDVSQILVDAGILSDEIEVGPVAEAAVVEWLSQRDLPHGNAAEIIEVTNGYPIYLEDYVARLEAGDSAPTLLSATHTQLFDLTWNALSPAAQKTARALCVLPDPLQEAELAELLGTDIYSLNVMLEELTLGRLFTEPPINGQLWFHDLRRRHLLDTKLSSEERQAAATTAYQISAARADTPDVAQWANLLAELAVMSNGLDGTAPRIQAISEAGPTELAILGALLEVRHPPGTNGAAMIDSVYEAAVELTPAEIDLEAAVAWLSDRELLVAVSNDKQTALVPRLSGQEQAIVIGRSTHVLTRTIIPDIAQAVFEISLRAALEPFDDGVYGSGDRSLTDLVSDIQYSALRKAGEPIPFRPAEAIVGRARLGTRWVWFGIRYQDRQQRDEPAHRLNSAPLASVLGEPVRIESVLVCPPAAVRARRLYNAAQHAATGKFDLNRPLKAPKIEGGLTLEQSARLRVETLALTRAISSADERIALDLEELTSLYWDASDKHAVEVTVSGSVAESRRIPGLISEAWPAGGNLFSARQLGREPSARVTRVRDSLGDFPQDHPVVMAMVDRAEKARKYNKSAPKTRLDHSEKAVSVLLETGYYDLRANARRFAELCPEHSEFREGMATYVLVVSVPDNPGWMPGFGYGIVTATLDSESGKDEFHLAWVDDPGTNVGDFPRPVADVDELFQEAFDLPNWRDVDDPGRKELTARRYTATRSGDLLDLVCAFTGWDDSSATFLPTP